MKPISVPHRVIPMHRRELIRRSGLLALAGICPIRSRAAEAASEWQPLFNGKSLEGWSFFQDGVGNVDRLGAVSIAKDGILHFLPPSYRGAIAPPGHIATVAEWDDFHLRLDFRYGETRWPPRRLQRRNSGILYHMGPQTDRLFPDCVEFQLEEGDVGDAIMVNTLGLQGPSLGGTPLWPNWIPDFPSDYQTPVRAGSYDRQWHRHAGDYERLDDWNQVDLYAFGDQAAHLVNGRIVNSIFRMVKTDSDGNKVPLTKGRIALELEWAEVMFRNVIIRPLDQKAIERIKAQGSD